jgi:hypothetical protein
MDETPRGCSNDANVHSLMRVRSGSGRMSGLRQERPILQVRIWLDELAPFTQGALPALIQYR